MNNFIGCVWPLKVMSTSTCWGLASAVLTKYLTFVKLEHLSTPEVARSEPIQPILAPVSKRPNS